MMTVSEDGLEGAYERGTVVLVAIMFSTYVLSGAVLYLLYTGRSCGRDGQQPRTLKGCRAKRAEYTNEKDCRR
jgi:hypothetical protein